MTGTTNSTPTTPPYSNFSYTSSTAQPPQQSVQQQFVAPPTTAAQTDSNTGLNTSDWLLMAAGMTITGLIGYFSSLMAVNSDIAENRKNISVIQTEVSHIKDDVSEASSDIKDAKKLSQQTAILKLRVDNMEKSYNKHTERVAAKKQESKPANN